MRIVGYVVMEFLPAKQPRKPGGDWAQRGGFWTTYEAAERARRDRCSKEPEGAFFVMAQYNREGV